MRHPIRNLEYGRSARRASFYVGFAAIALSLLGCHTSHEIEVAPTHHTVKIEPIYMTVDINLRIQRELDEFYSDVVGGAQDGSEQGEQL